MQRPNRDIFSATDVAPFNYHCQQIASSFPLSSAFRACWILLSMSCRSTVHCSRFYGILTQRQLCDLSDFILRHLIATLTRPTRSKANSSTHSSRRRRGRQACINIGTYELQRWFIVYIGDAKIAICLLATPSVDLVISRALGISQIVENIIKLQFIIR
ncbi:hypothetical protein CPC08DRAFT_393442 [Agrocybe pediades]|nr:hypothetical protein CPC08DRAFT_393442 [Agrocybe pediades]